MVLAVGGAMDLAQGSKRVFVIADHMTKKGTLLEAAAVT
jgi:acyl CoA:acetate/3-ketoacid CoA transferase beta subunit